MSNCKKDFKVPEDKKVNAKKVVKALSASGGEIKARGYDSKLAHFVFYERDERNKVHKRAIAEIDVKMNGKITGAEVNELAKKIPYVDGRERFVAEIARQFQADFGDVINEDSQSISEE
ncbi:hypothetical protein J7J26_03080 [Candidatus Micrarchaeota archaeon]|nr:hypothetical protein [Candidatus Micrarchaeota archaeon]